MKVRLFPKLKRKRAKPGAKPAENKARTTSVTTISITEEGFSSGFSIGGRFLDSTFFSHDFSFNNQCERGNSSDTRLERITSNYDCKDAITESSKEKADDSIINRKDSWRHIESKELGADDDSDVDSLSCSPEEDKVDKKEDATHLDSARYSRLMQIRSKVYSKRDNRLSTRSLATNQEEDSSTLTSYEDKKCGSTNISNSDGKQSKSSSTMKQYDHEQAVIGSRSTDERPTMPVENYWGGEIWDDDDNENTPVGSDSIQNDDDEEEDEYGYGYAVPDFDRDARLEQSRKNSYHRKDSSSSSRARHITNRWGAELRGGESSSIADDDLLGRKSNGSYSTITNEEEYVHTSNSVSRSSEGRVEGAAGGKSIAEDLEYGNANPDTAVKDTDSCSTITFYNECGYLPYNSRHSGVILYSSRIRAALEEDLGYESINDSYSTLTDENEYGSSHHSSKNNAAHMRLLRVRQTKDKAPRMPDNCSYSTIIDNAENEYCYGHAISNNCATSNDSLIPSRNVVAVRPAKDQAPMMPARRSITRRDNCGSHSRRRRTLGCDIQQTVADEEQTTEDRPKRARSITFALKSDIKEVEPISSLVEKPEDIWFQKTDYSQFKEMIRSTVDETKRGRHSPGTSCLRGLEGFLDITNKRRRQDRAKESVLCPNYHERGCDRVVGGDDNDEEEISARYKRSSLESKTQAEQRAAEDAATVEGYLQSTRRLMMRRFSC